MKYLCVTSVMLIIIGGFVVGQTHTGSINGKIIDVRTQEPLAGVNVAVIEKPGAGAASQEDGQFFINNIEVDTYSLRVSIIGYETRIVTNVVISTGRQTPVFISLREQTIETKEVTVQASYYDKGSHIAPVSTNILDRSEILRLPGSIQDVQRVVQNLPGVASSMDQLNELIVRGGATYENLIIMDHMEIPSINHFSNQYNSAGPINMINADMIRDVQFSAGGFPVQYGDRSASVMNLSMREGNKNVGFASKSGLNMSGLGTLVEGGLFEGKGSFIFSARQSLLQVLDKLTNALDLIAIPKYWDVQSKIIYDITPTAKLSLNVLYGESTINSKGDPMERDALRVNMIDTSSVLNFYSSNSQYVVGLNYQQLHGKQGYSILTLYSVGSTYDEDFYNHFVRRVRGAQGDILSSETLNENLFYSNRSHESFAAAKYELFYQLSDAHDISFGAQVQTMTKWKNDIYMAADTIREDKDGDGYFEIGPLVNQPWNVHRRHNAGDASKYFVYASDKILISPSLSLTLGLRYDYFTFSRKGSLSPRVSLLYQLIPGTTSLTLATGLYYQTHPFLLYNDKQNSDANKLINNMKAEHYVASLDHYFNDGLKVTIEGYYKWYSNIALPEGFIRNDMSNNFSEILYTIGKRRSYGVELFIEQKQLKDFYGILSVSLAKTEDKDMRVIKRSEWYQSEFNYPIIITALAGNVVRGVRDWLDDAPFFLKYPSYILPFSNEMEYSIKYRYQRGRPYTPQQYVTTKQNREGGIKWSAGAWIDGSEINSALYPDYSRVDFQWLSRYYLDNWNINVFLMVLNVFDTKNIFFENNRSDGTRETAYQFRLMPVLGVEIEF